MQLNKENIKNNRVVRHTYYYLNGIVNRSKLIHKAEETIKQFGVVYPSEEIKKSRIKDMIRMNMLYGFGFDEYLYYQFANKTMDERLAFVADWEHLGYTCAMNNPQNADIFDNKWKTYQLYNKYYHRDVQYCEGKESQNDFKAFLFRHVKAIIKPLDASCGHGVKIVHGGGTLEELACLFDELLLNNNGRFLMEELILQAEGMAQFHPKSVNTIRVTTIRLDDDVLIVHPFMRMGQQDNYVDNGGAGGIMCPIDAESGRIVAAADKDGKSFRIHPDTKKEIIGFPIPKWDELIELTKELAQVLPENRYAGWDLALTDSGWVMVEANRRGQFVGWQIPTQIGFRKELNEICGALGIHY